MILHPGFSYFEFKKYINLTPTPLYVPAERGRGEANLSLLGYKRMQRGPIK